MLICRTCGFCCRNTEMQLSQQDISRIIEKSTPKNTQQDFSEVKNGSFYLKNIDDHCIFLEPTHNFCTIYSDRPTGCRFYPMIFDSVHNQCIIDRDCPFSERFYSEESEFRKNCRALRNWIFTKLVNLPTKP